MRLLSIGLVLGLTACGGSASETPFPTEPLPDYLTRKQSEAASSAAARPSASAEETSEVAPSEPPSRPQPSGPQAPRAPRPATGPAF